MRDFEQAAPGEKQNAPQGHAPQKAKPRGEGEHSQQHAARAEAGSHAAAHAEILGDERASHPANAEPLAELLSQLQHSHGNAYVQRVVSEMGGAKSGAESQTHESVRSLDGGVRAEMESAFGEDFGDVRVHTGKPAGDAAEQLGARAFTRGRDIYFNEREYDPSTRAGKEVLAHELTHVAQQRRGGGTNGHGPDGREAVEREADEAGRLVASGGAARVEFRADRASTYLQQQPRGAAPSQPQAAQSQPPQQQPAQAAPATVSATPAMDAAFRQIFFDSAFQDVWASFFVMQDDRCPGFLRLLFAERFPRAMADLRAQRPPNMAEETFLSRYFEAVWSAVRTEFRRRLRQLYRTSPTFRQRVRDLQRPIPPDAMVA